VIGGSAGWWLALTTVIGLFHTKIDERAMRVINRTCGALLIIIGLVILGHLAIKYSSGDLQPLSQTQNRPGRPVSGLGIASPLI